MEMLVANAAAALLGNANLFQTVDINYRYQVAQWTEGSKVAALARQRGKTDNMSSVVIEVQRQRRRLSK
eukprot:1159928-Pelagomonas_calceolata.AAC.14